MTLKVLYIGGAGEISYDCVHNSVTAGHQVYVYNRGTSGEAFHDAVERITGDINDPAAYGRLGDMGFDVVCQFRNFTPKEVERDIAVFSGKTDQYVFISSASAYQKPPVRAVITEETPLVNPYWEYSRQKAACEAMIAGQTALPFTILRPSHTFRTRPPSLFGEAHLAMRRMLAGKPIVISGDGTSLWTITSALDFAPPFVRLLGNQKAIGEAFHLTSDLAVTWDQIYQAVARALGVVADFAHVSADTLVRYEPDWLGPLHGDKIHSAVFDNTKIKSVVGDFACEGDLDTTLKRPLSYFRPDAAPAENDARHDALFDRIATDQRALA
jgi:nucleoside-diphosphate-sugar epimerase